VVFADNNSLIDGYDVLTASKRDPPLAVLLSSADQCRTGRPHRFVSIGLISRRVRIDEGLTADRSSSDKREAVIFRGVALTAGQLGLCSALVEEGKSRGGNG
jgi:hypothetical protein